MFEEKNELLMYFLTSHVVICDTCDYKLNRECSCIYHALM
jgi:hypothetical protein